MNTPSRYFAVVRRGETEVFRALLQALERQPGPVQIIWDRHGPDRRRTRGEALPERRRGDRRSPPPHTWGPLGFCFAPYRQIPVAR